MRGVQDETLPLHLPGGGLHLAGQAQLQHRGVHGDRSLSDCMPQARSRRDNLEVPIRWQRSHIQVRMSLAGPSNKQIGPRNSPDGSSRLSMVEIAHEPLKKV